MKEKELSDGGYGRQRLGVRKEGIGMRESLDQREREYVQNETEEEGS